MGSAGILTHNLYILGFAGVNSQLCLLHSVVQNRISRVFNLRGGRVVKTITFVLPSYSKHKHLANISRREYEV